MIDDKSAYSLQVNALSRGSGDVSQWPLPDPDRRFMCALCGAPTSADDPGNYAELDVRLEEPGRRVSVGAHVTCLRAAVGDDRAHVFDGWDDEDDRPQRPPQPPITFDMYGLTADAWAGPRWFAFADGPWEGPAHSVVLEYGHDDWPTYGRSPWFSVETVDLALARSAGEIYDDDAQQEWLANRGLFRLSNQVPTPELSRHQNQIFWRRVIDAVTDQSRQVAAWATTSWRVDGAVVEARWTQFGGGWTAFALVAETTAVIVNGSGHESNDVALTKLANTAEYHVDLHAPISWNASLEARRAALGDDLEPDWDDSVVHPDITAFALDL